MKLRSNAQNKNSLKNELLKYALDECLQQIAKVFEPSKKLICFVSYAWGNEYAKHVDILVEDLRLAGFEIPFDLDNGPGNILSEYTQLIEKADFIIINGTKKLLEKYNTLSNESSKSEPVVKLELELIFSIYRTNRENKKRIRTILWEGEINQVFPLFLRDPICIDFTEQYVEGLFELIRSLYGIERKNPQYTTCKDYYSSLAASIESKDLDEHERTYQEQQTQINLQKDLSNEQWIKSKIELISNNSKQAGVSAAGNIYYSQSNLQKLLELKENEVSVKINLQNNHHTKLWHLPHLQYSTFVERLELTEELNHKIQAYLQKLSLVALCGLGGVGKTQLALHYAYEKASNYNLVVWFEVDKLLADYQQYAQYKNLISKLPNEQELIAIVKHWFEVNSGWLLIYNNADNYEHLKKYLPRFGGEILITSRNPNWPDHINVDVMTEKQAISLAEKIIKREDEKISELIKMLGYLPLAIAQASAYIFQKNKKIADYLRLYQTQRDKLLSDNTFPPGYANEPVAITWQLNLLEVQERNSNAARLLYLLTFFHSESISFALLQQTLFKKIDDESEIMLDEVLSILRDYSLIKFNKESLSISIHQLLQAVISKNITLEDKPSYLLDAMDGLHKTYNCDVSFREQEERKLGLLSHFQHIVCQIEKLKENFTKDHQLLYAKLLHHLGYITLYHLGKPQEAKKLFEQELNIEKQYYGNEHLEIIKTLANLGNACGELGDFYKKKALLRQAYLLIKTKHSNINFDECVHIMTNLGVAYYNLNKLKISEKLLKYLISNLEKHYDKENIIFSDVLFNLSNVYMAFGNLQKQKELLDQVLYIEEKYYGNDHYSLISTLTSLGNLYSILGKLDDAKANLERALKIATLHYGESHYLLAPTLGSIADLYGKLGDTSREKSLLERALQILEEHYDNESPALAAPLTNLGGVYYLLKMFDKAKAYLERSLHIEEQFYGKDYYNLAYTLTNLGEIYRIFKDYDTAKNYLERALKLKEDHYGANHWELVTTIRNLSLVYIALNLLKESKVLLLRANEIISNNPEILSLCALKEMINQDLLYIGI